MRANERSHWILIFTSKPTSNSKEIRELLGMNMASHPWLLPSRLADNPQVWMLQVNGFMIDIRDARVELQRAAYAKGLIPFVPAERGAGNE